MYIVVRSTPADFEEMTQHLLRFSVDVFSLTLFLVCGRECFAHFFPSVLLQCNAHGRPPHGTLGTLCRQVNPTLKHSHFH